MGRHNLRCKGAVKRWLDIQLLGWWHIRLWRLRLVRGVRMVWRGLVESWQCTRQSFRVSLGLAVVGACNVSWVSFKDVGSDGDMRGDGGCLEGSLHPVDSTSAAHRILSCIPCLNHMMESQQVKTALQNI